MFGSNGKRALVGLACTRVLALAGGAYAYFTTSGSGTVQVAPAPPSP